MLVVICTSSDFDPLTGRSIIDRITNGSVSTYARAQSSFGSLAFDASVSSPTAVGEETDDYWYAHWRCGCCEY